MRLIDAVAQINKYLFVIFTLSFNVAGGYFAKLAASSSDTINLVLTFVAISCYGTAFITYILALKYIPLFVVQSLLASQYVMMVAISYFIFRESISLSQGIGIVMIFGGIALVVNR